MHQMKNRHFDFIYQLSAAGLILRESPTKRAVGTRINRIATYVACNPKIFRKAQ